MSKLEDVRSPLKWPGGKKRVLPHIGKHLLTKKGRLIEPFVGGGSVFLNMPHKQFYLVDTNRDLINLYQAIQTDCSGFIRDVQRYFRLSTNQADTYYALRSEFNQSTDAYQRSLLFFYLNRHGYNGLCRYNQKGGYNVPFGRYKHPYFPLAELEHLGQKLQRAELFAGDFSHAFAVAKTGDIIYCDPPYTPLNNTANFTAYAGNIFAEEDQQRLVQLAKQAQKNGITTVISNHLVPFTKHLYADASKQHTFHVQRSISRKGDGRQPVKEILAIYHASE